MKRRIVIKCDGGFGNRYNSLVTGLYIARIYDLDVKITWPETNACMGKYVDLFNPLYDVVDEDYIGNREQFLNMVHYENVPNLVAGISILNIKEMNDLHNVITSSNKDILFSTSLIPEFFDLGILSLVMDNAGFNDTIIKEANSFLTQNQLSQFVGLHLRRTDFMVDESQDVAMENIVKSRPDLKFFVCSDSKETEERFLKQPNVVVYAKTSYVTKNIEGGWRENYLGDDGRLLRFNVMREAESVWQALVDLTLLSKAELIDTSHSTFLRTAMLIRAKERNLLKFDQKYGSVFSS